MLSNLKEKEEDIREVFDISKENGVIQNIPFGTLVPKIVNKKWGHEEIYYNKLYCMKKLYVKKECRTSKHFHINKHETLLCLKGSFIIELYNKDIKDSAYLKEGDAFVVVPGLVHSIYADHSDSILLESSTFSEDSDSIRIF